MPNTLKARAAAQAALDAYRAVPGFDKQEERVSLGDLLVDLAHLADTFTDPDETTTGAYELERAADIYYEEAEEAEAQTYEDSYPDPKGWI